MSHENPDEPSLISAADTLFVEKIRRGIALYDRLRPYLIAVYGITLIVTFGGLLVLVNILQGANVPGLGQGITVGLVLGSWGGSMLILHAHGFTNALYRGRKSDRLLVQYHDALMEIGRIGDRGSPR